jgi:5-hydroxyisourate hydrolase
MTGLTTHVLDTVKGTGAAGLRVEVLSPDAQAVTVTLDDTGRATLRTVLATGAYELRFHAGEYCGEVLFYDIIPVRFIVDAPESHYHIPLILSAYGYSTYRGG